MAHPYWSRSDNGAVRRFRSNVLCLLCFNGLESDGVDDVCREMEQQSSLQDLTRIQVAAGGIQVHVDLI